MPATTTAATATIKVISVMLNAGMFTTYLPFFELPFYLRLETHAVFRGREASRTQVPHCPRNSPGVF
jgi:hypothetical protein